MTLRIGPTLQTGEPIVTPRTHRPLIHQSTLGNRRIVVLQRVQPPLPYQHFHPQLIEPPGVGRPLIRDLDPDPTTISNINRVSIQIPRLPQPPVTQPPVIRRWRITPTRPLDPNSLDNPLKSAAFVKTLWAFLFFIPGSVLLGTSFIPNESNSLSQGLRWTGVSLIILSIIPIVVCNGEE